MADWQRIQAHEERARLLHRLGREEEAAEACEEVRLINSKRGDALVLELFPGRSGRRWNKNVKVVVSRTGAEAGASPAINCKASLRDSRALFAPKGLDKLAQGK